MNTNPIPTTHIRHPLVLAALLALPLTFAVGCDDDAEPVATPPAETDDHANHEGHDEDEADHSDHDDHEHGDATPLPSDFNTSTAPHTVLARSDR